MTYSTTIHSTITTQPKATKVSPLEAKASSKTEILKGKKGKASKSVALTLILSALIGFTSTNAFAGCKFGDQTIAVGGDISLPDEFLIAEEVRNLMSQGYSAEESAGIASRSDWLGIVLVCVNSYTKSNKVDPNQPASMIDVSTPVLIPIGHQIEFVAALKREASNMK